MPGAAGSDGSMVLSAARHHSAQVGADELHVAPRSQKTDRTAGERSGVLEEPVPPGVLEHAVCPCTGAPSLAVLTLPSSGDGIDKATLSFLLQQTFLERQRGGEGEGGSEEEGGRGP